MEPQLAAPGAGLPWLELQVARMLFRLRRWTGTSLKFQAQFSVEQKAILAQLAFFSAEQAGQRVLIPRLRGLEDSSRYWSVWMTLEHLRIVNTQIAHVIPSLVRGTVPPGQASTAQVKPRSDVGSAVLAGYEDSCGALLAVAAETPTLRTGARFGHPWFGPLDAYGWHALAAVHMGIHRRQIEQIGAVLRGL